MSDINAALSSTEPRIDPNAGAPADSLAPVEREAGATAAGESASGAQALATGTSATAAIDLASSASTAMLASESQTANSLNPADAPVVAALGESGSSPAPNAAAQTPASGDASVGGPATQPQSDAHNRVWGTLAPIDTRDRRLMESGINVPDDGGNLLGAGTAGQSAAPAIASAADTLLARWHREMSVIGRGLSAETEKLIRETKAHLGL